VGIEQSRLFFRGKTDGAKRLHSSRRQNESAKPIGRHSPRAAIARELRPRGGLQSARTAEALPFSAAGSPRPARLKGE
jgi:hypothetical protein